MVVTIDGPAGSGKSTVAKLLAAALGLTYLDTGATYRALALAALQEPHPPVGNPQLLAALARHLPLRLEFTAGRDIRVWLGDDDVTKKIRTEQITEIAAQLSQFPEVRRVMVERQRELTTRHGVVVEGRDTGSVVFPDATFKFFLDADAAVRAKRRQEELRKTYGSRTPLPLIRDQIDLRDSLDRTRSVGPLVRPAGALVIDTTDLTARQVTDRMLAHIRRGARR